MIVVADTSGLLAAGDERRVEHRACRAIVDQRRLAISQIVLAEFAHLTKQLAGLGPELALMATLLDRLEQGRDQLAELSLSELRSAQRLRERYAGLELDLADAVAVVLADRLRTNEIFTLDQRDFPAIRPLTERFDAFRILPFES